METAEVAGALRQMLLVTLEMAAPSLLVALVIGSIVSMLQAATQVHETALAFIPKLLAIGLTLLLTGAFMLRVLSVFTKMLLAQIVMAGGS
ncbi:MAG TPA: flagellar biosynthetic protein FliQ [Acetobacteraceae bacterium]|jgi:flagellar biosynthetic protein FliQ|nr:flagellar biosynthetic protein FliQ [Acetobacteraceae bacterium]